MEINRKLFIDTTVSTKNNIKYCPVCRCLLSAPIFDISIQKNVCQQCIDLTHDTRVIDDETLKDIVQYISYTSVKCAICQEELDLKELESHISELHSNFSHLLSPSFKSKLQKASLKDVSLPISSSSDPIQKNQIIITEKDVTYPNDLFLDIEDEICEDTNYLKALDEAIFIAEETGLRSKSRIKKFERDLHANVKMELNSSMHTKFNRDNIPMLLKNNPEYQKKKELEKRKESFQNNCPYRKFSGSLTEIVHKKDDGKCIFYFALKGNTQCIFLFPVDFTLYDHYKYTFFADVTSDFFRGYQIYNVVVNRKFPLNAEANLWCENSFKSLMRKLFEKAPLKYMIDRFEELTDLDPKAYVIPDHLKENTFFEKYFHHIRNYIPFVLKKHIEHMKDFKFFFFNNEIEDLYRTWVPSRECLLGLKIDALFVLYHLFFEGGDPKIKTNYFNYLFLRPKKINIQIFENTYKLSEFFLCKSKVYEWAFPTYDILDKTLISEYVFSKMRKPPSLASEFRILMTILRNKKDSDTCIYLSQISSEILAEKVDESYLLNNLQELRSILVVPDEKNNDQLLVAWDYYPYTKMLELALCNILNNYIIHHEEFLAKPFDAIHSNSDEKYTKIYENMELCGKQSLAFYYAQKLPITFIDGEAGRGKTAVEGKICQYFDKDEVLYLSSQNTTVYSVGFQKVCRRTFTVSRFLILHDMFCMNTANPEHLKEIIYRTNNFKNPENPELFQFPFQSNDLYMRKKHYCEQFECCFNKCLLEDIKCIFIDESSLLDIVNACRIFYVISMCCHPTVRIVIAGDNGQLASISAGMVHKDFINIFSPWMVKLDIDHRFKGESSIKNISNNEAIREGKYELFHFDMKTKFDENSDVKRYLADKFEVNENIRAHFIEITEINGKDTDEEILRKLKPTLDYLIMHPYYLNSIKDIGETLRLQMCCPTNKIKNLINRYITDTIFTSKIPKDRQTSQIMHIDGVKVDVFKGMKIVYKKNIYDGINLCNNLLYVVAKIEDVSFKGKGKKKETKIEIKEDNEYEDDLITEDSDDTYILNAGGSLSVERSSKNILTEYNDFIESEVVPGHEDLLATHYLGPIGIPRSSWGRRLIVVPANDVDDATGEINSWENARMIPWTKSHWHNISRASTTTIFGSQGREFENILIFFPSFYEPRDVNPLLYVASTRAKCTVTIVSTEHIFKNIIQNFPEDRKSHFHSFLSPILQKYYVNPLLKIKIIPEDVVCKIEKDNQIIEETKRKVEEFRKKKVIQSLPALTFTFSSDLNPDEKLDEENAKKLHALMMKRSLNKEKKTFFQLNRDKKEREYPKDNNDAEKYQPIAKKQKPTLNKEENKIVTAEQNPLLQKKPSLISRRAPQIIRRR